MTKPRPTHLDPTVYKGNTIRRVYTILMLPSTVHHVIKELTILDKCCTLDGHLCSTFKDACSKQPLEVAAMCRSPHKLRYLFEIMPIFYNLTDAH